MSVLAVTETAMGWAGVALEEGVIRRATLFHHSREACERELRAFGAVDGEDARASEALAILRAYAGGEGGMELESFPCNPDGEPFQKQAWLTLREIPRGETRSYGWMARRLGDAKAARAVGAAMGANPIPLWLPCHRLVAADGSLHGFGGGLAMKQALLELEGALPRRLALP